MTVSTTTNRYSYAGNGTTTAFVYSSKFLANEDLVVMLVEDDGTETEQILNTHYTVVGAGSASGGAITMATAPASGESLVIYGDPEITQTMDLVENDPLPAEEVEDAYDRLTLIAQRLSDRIDRTLRLSDGDTTTGEEMLLPTEADRASKVLGFDEDGVPVALANVPASGVSATAFTESLLDDADAATARATLGVAAVDSIAALKDVSKLTYSHAHVLGYYAAGDGGGGLYHYDASDTTSTDNGGSIIVADDGARWKLLHGGVIHTKQFGATHNGITNDATAINAAATFAATLTQPKLVVDPGTAKCDSTITMAVGDGATIEFLGEILSSVTGTTALLIGKTSAYTYNLHVTGVSVRRSSADTSGGSIGIHLRNLAFAFLDVKQVLNFQNGVYCHGSTVGFVYNRVFLGCIQDNKTNLELATSSSGWVNENNFYGGSFGHSSGYPAVVTRNLLINHDATNSLNNNRFWGPSFEDHTDDAIAATVSGQNNVIYWPRMENSGFQSTYPIEFTANSNECEVAGGGFTMENSNISDSGLNNKYETREGRRISAPVPNDAAKAVLSLMSSTSNIARLLRCLDTSGSVTATILGSGAASFTALSVSLSNFADDTAAASGGVAVGQLYRTASAVKVRVA